MSNKPKEFWIYDKEDNSFSSGSCRYNGVMYVDTPLHLKDEDFNDLEKISKNLIEKSAYDKAIDTLNFLYHGDCGDCLGTIHFEAVRLILEELGEL